MKNKKKGNHRDLNPRFEVVNQCFYPHFIDCDLKKLKKNLNHRDLNTRPKVVIQWFYPLIH